MNRLVYALAALGSVGTSITLVTVLEIDTIAGGIALGLPIGLLWGLAGWAVSR